ncbi:MAG: MlaD family protein [Bacteroidetes bacterium]|nr:MlaD family protein [Bacteroidota bacterium]
MIIRNEVKIGLAVVIATALFYIGTRYFRDLPIWGQADMYYTELPHSKGLVVGNVVAVNGVAVGSVSEVRLTGTGAHIAFSINDKIPLTEGTTTSAGGFGFVSSVQLNLLLGPPDAPIYPSGSLIPATSETDFFSDLGDRAPVLLNRVDTFLAGTNTAMTAATDLLSNPQGQMNQTLSSIQTSAEALQSILLAEQGSLQATLNDVQSLSNTLETFTEDSLGSVTTEVKQIFDQLSNNLDLLESTMTELNSLIASINEGQGTLGKLAHDDSLYTELLGTTSALKTILEDFQENPAKYLEHLKLVDVF